MDNYMLRTNKEEKKKFMGSTC